MALFSPGREEKGLFFLRFVHVFPPFVQYSLQLIPRILYNVKNIMHISFSQQTDKLEFARRAGGQDVRNICVVVSALHRSVSFRGAVAGRRLPGHCEPVLLSGVAISRIEVPFFDNTWSDSGKWYKNSLYDDGLPEIRWRFPHQSEDWFGMTCSDDASNSNLLHHRTIPSGAGHERLQKFSARLVSGDSPPNSNLLHCCFSR